MTSAPWLAWLALGISLGVYLVAVATLAICRRSPSRPGSEPTSGDECAQAQMALFDVQGATGLLHGIRMGSAIAAASALAIALTFAEAPFGQAIAGGGVALAVALIGIQWAIKVMGSHESRWAYRLLNPVARAAQQAAELPGIRAFLYHGNGGGSNGTRSQDVALDEGLSLLHAVGISTDPGEARMIRAILSMDTARVREIMRPRVDMVVASDESTINEMSWLMTEQGHSRIPIYKETIDTVVGVVHAQDVLRRSVSASDGGSPSVRELARPALFVPESQRLDQLLREFQQARTQLAIVVDEYGGVAGLVTVQDLIEEIVGELVDEFDRHEPQIHRVNDVEVVIDAKMPLEVLKHEFGADIEGEGFDTVGGLIYRELGKMPSSGDSVQVDGLLLRVESTIGRRIRMIRVKKQDASLEMAS